MDLIKCIYCNKEISINRFKVHLKGHNKSLLDYLLKLNELDEIPKCKFCSSSVNYNVHGFYNICKSESCKKKNKSERMHLENLRRKSEGTHPWTKENRSKDENGNDIQGQKIKETRIKNHSYMYKCDRPKDENGNDIIAKKMVESGKCSLLSKNRPKDENGKDIYSSLSSKSAVNSGKHNLLKRNRLIDPVTGRDTIFKSRILNPQDLNEDYFKTLVKDGIFSISDCMEHFGIAPTTANHYKIHFLGHIPESELGIGCKHLHQNEVSDFIKSLGIEVKDNYRKLFNGHKELDIYVPDYKLAFEYDGIYWHSNIDPNYHVNKTNLCEKNGIKLFHIFENEWMNPIKRRIWKSVIMNSVGKSEVIYARKCEVKLVHEGIKNFLNENHLQGFIPSEINYGLYYEGKLVSLMTFGKSRYDKSYDYEILRFCNLINTRVVGAASRLLSHFIKDHPGKSIVSYANRRWSNGKLYESLGFKKVKVLGPSYFYTKDNYTLLSRYQCQKYKLPDLLKDKYNPDLTEYQNMITNKYRIIYDCGNIKYVLLPES